jgi:hypothetical protein
LYSALNLVDRYMMRSGVMIEKIFTVADEAGAQRDPKDLEKRVHTVYSELAVRPGELVSLARLRDKLADVTRDDLDRVLVSMDRARDIQLEPDPNRKALPPEAREAAVRIGGEDKHLVAIGSL